jgi:amidase
MKTTDSSLELAGRGALELADLVRSGAVTAVEVLEQHLARIDARDGELNAFQVVLRDRARAEAAEIDARPDRGRLPLAGVPVAVKDNVDVAGSPTRHGSAATSVEDATDDDELVRRLREAGAVIIGKTKMPELAAWAFTESQAFGVTRNPWDPQRSPGGSTGGGAVAVAAGMAALALGSDGGGSLRVPAAYCGVVGYKPAAGVVPLADGAAEHWRGLTAFGPIAGTVADVALAVDVLAGRTPSALPAVAGPLRIGLLLNSPSPMSRLDPAVRAGVEGAVEMLQTARHRIVRPKLRYPAQLIAWWEHRWFAGIADDARRLASDRQADLERRTRVMVRRGRLVNLLGGPRPAVARRWRERAARWFDEFDVLVTPVVAVPAPPAEGMTGRGYLRTLVPSAKAVPYCQAWNLAGFPALSVPVGFGAEGLPLAVQVISLPGHEDDLLRAAAELERLCGRLSGSHSRLI